MISYICLVLLFASICTSEIKLPSYMKICKLSDPKINQCVHDLFESARPHLKEGIPELRIPSLEPLQLEKLSLKLTSLDIESSKLNIYGITEFQMKKTDLDVANKELILDVDVPKAYIAAHYNVKGKLLMIDLNGEGEAKFNISDINVKGSLRYELKKDGDKTIMDFKDTKLVIKVGDVKMHLSNLFKDNDELTESTNQIINENIKELLPGVLPLIENTVSSLLLKIIHDVFAELPVDV